MLVNQKPIFFLIDYYKSKVSQNRVDIFKECFKEYKIKIKNYLAFLLRPLKRTNQFTKNRYDLIHTKRNILNSLIPEFNKKVHYFKGRFFLASEGLMKKIYQSIVIQVIEKTKTEKILEVGCGSGINLKIISDYFNGSSFSFCGIDQSTAGINKANKLKETLLNDEYTQGLNLNFKYQKNSNNLEFIEGDAQKLNLKNQSFDFVYTVLALEQMSNIQEKVIDEMKRVSSKYILLIEPFKELNNWGIKYFYHKSKKYFNINPKDISTKDWEIIEYNYNFPNLLHLKTGYLLLKKIKNQEL